MHDTRKTMIVAKESRWSGGNSGWDGCKFLSRNRLKDSLFFSVQVSGLWTQQPLSQLRYAWLHQYRMRSGWNQCLKCSASTSTKISGPVLIEGNHSPVWNVGHLGTWINEPRGILAWLQLGKSLELFSLHTEWFLPCFRLFQVDAMERWVVIAVHSDVCLTGIKLWTLHTAKMPSSMPPTSIYWCTREGQLEPARRIKAVIVPFLMLCGNGELQTSIHTLMVAWQHDCVM